MAEFMRPTVTTEEVNDTIARFIVEPLERGFGYTLGNCMRRVLLSSLDGARATAIQIEGVQHEFTTAEGVIEDVTDIALNVKGLVFQALPRITPKLRLPFPSRGPAPSPVRTSRFRPNSPSSTPSTSSAPSPTAAR